MGLDVGEVGHPEPVGARRRRSGDRRGRSDDAACSSADGRALVGRPRRAPQSPSSRIRRSTVQRATAIALAVELGPDLVGPVDPSRLSSWTRLISAFSSSSRTRSSAGRPAPGGVVGGGSELQGPADRLDSPSTLVGRRCSALLLRSTVELGREENRGVLQDLVRPPELTVLLLEVLEALRARRW